MTPFALHYGNGEEKNKQTNKFNLAVDHKEKLQVGCFTGQECAEILDKGPGQLEQHVGSSGLLPSVLPVVAVCLLQTL